MILNCDISTPVDHVKAADSGTACDHPEPVVALEMKRARRFFVRTAASSFFGDRASLPDAMRLL
jgi:hypothetical protein